MVSKSPDAPRGAASAATDAPPVSITAPEAGRKLFVIAKSPDEPLLAQLRALGWEIAVAKSAGAAQNMTSSAGVAAGLIDFTGFTSRDFPALKACLSLPAIGWISVAQAGVSIGQAVRELIRSYCFDYVTLPLPYEWISHVLGHARGMAALDRVDGAAYAASIGEHGMIGNCEAMQQLFSTIRKVAKTDASVFISGESGTGKELTALAIHERSARAKGPFVAINCGAIPHHLLQSELFGYERGAFTGANQRRAGRIESADGGTLFLDEIGDMPLESQASMLRFLQEGRIERLGGQEPIQVNVRIVSATHVDLDGAVESGRFRADLYHRLCVLRIHEPPLRARGKDIDILAHYVLQKYKADSGRKISGFTSAALDAMRRYEWPGNVRELINRVRRGIVMAESRLLTPHDLGLETPGEAEPVTLEQARALAERTAIENALLRNDHRINKAAAELGISRVTLYRMMIEHGLSDHDNGDGGKDGAPTEPPSGDEGHRRVG
ncbi:sigma-54 dependent transcriptional regulator [Burkholderia ubonensis]|uniref:Sigma-54-dependent Fis family transcriptional regulator n=1 Tax=Burkholderia ubonensis TaxID=101571 RepID=A0A1R1JJJ4_9BURK|nr:sigma-54 dependent transcriptional regulator [Burkholderia ubonensis]OMG75363.1 sigma-54-dependent Fis family transcriptional regulator [Burkholderia ubonensis]